MQGEFIFPAGFFPGRDGPADAAGMPAVKGLSHRLAECMRVQIIRKHRGPRNCLQGRPMQSRGHNEREDYQVFAKAMSTRIIVETAKKPRKAAGPSFT